MKTKLPIFIVLATTLFSGAVVAFAFFYRNFVGMQLYDFHPEEAEAINRALTIQQQHFLGVCFDTISGVYSCFLLITNVAWIAASCYLLVLLRNRKAITDKEET